MLQKFKWIFLVNSFYLLQAHIPSELEIRTRNQLMSEVVVAFGKFNFQMRAFCCFENVVYFALDRLSENIHEVDATPLMSYFTKICSVFGSGYASEDDTMFFYKDKIFCCPFSAAAEFSDEDFA